MIERWAIPVIPLGVEESHKAVEIGGRVFSNKTFILKPEDVERVRLGYVCINCLEPHPYTWPERCKVCDFPIERFQERIFEALYEEVRVGPSTTLEEEWEIAKEEVRKQRET